MVKYIVVTGGVISGVGKGIIASSTGLLLKTLGFEVTAIKIDPYLNIDAGTLSPLDHGEVFVLNDGGEVDLDLGNYERYLDVTLTRNNNITTGKIYQNVIEKERKGDYLGKTVQVVPHITDAIQNWILEVSNVSVNPEQSDRTPDICIIELGGTVGDIESAPFIEAMRQFQFRVGHDNFALIHVSLIPVVGSVGEQKTKPTQNTVRDLRGLGLSPDFIACRSNRALENSIKSKISMFCHVPPEQVLAVHDCASIYHVPLLLESQGFLNILRQRLCLDALSIPASLVENGSNNWARWKSLTRTRDRLHDQVSIGLVGKYTYLQDSYISVIKASEHASLACNRKLEICWIEASDLETETQTANPVKFHEAWKTLCSVQGILIPGGFGERGVNGKIVAAKYARENQIPFLGICLGLQIAVIEFARNVCGISQANSTEFDESTLEPFVIYMPEISKTHLGGTMRLGSRITYFQENTEQSVIRRLYGGSKQVLERHRHRYEVNPDKAEVLEEKGLCFVARDESGQRMEILELQGHPYFVGTQFHPEYLSRPLSPSPPFLGLILASINELTTHLESETATPVLTQANGYDGLANGKK